jgi:hypothetical protein
MSHRSAVLRISLFLALPFGALPAPAQQPASYVGLVEAGVERRSSGLEWKRSSNSELTYSDMLSREYAVRVQVRRGAPFGGEWRLEGELSGGDLLGGSVQDSDFRGYSPRAEVSRSLAEVTGDGVRAGSAGFGWHASLPEGWRLSGIALSFGGQGSARTIRKQNGVIVIPTTAPKDAMDGLDSSYASAWSGPWVALEPELRAFGFTAVMRYRLSPGAYYRADGTWNLREDLQQPISFTHQAFGSAHDLRLRVERPMRGGLALVVTASREVFAAERGVDTDFASDGRAYRIPLRDLRSTSRGVGVSLSGRF